MAFPGGHPTGPEGAKSRGDLICSGCDGQRRPARPACRDHESHESQAQGHKGGQRTAVGGRKHSSATPIFAISSSSTTGRPLVLHSIPQHHPSIVTFTASSSGQYIAF